MNMHTALLTPALAGTLLALPLALAPDAAAAQADGTTPVVVIVRVPKPGYVPRALVLSKMRDGQAEYARLDGLLFKAFSFEADSGDFGGVYYWRSRAAAQAWFNPAWFERVQRERGHAANVRYFEAPVSVDNQPGGTPANADSASVVTLVEIPLPAGASREKVAAAFRAAVPTYQQAPGLLRKHFTLSDNGSFGGVYLWRDEASARAWFNEAWHARVRQTYGADGRIEWFSTPVLLPTLNPANSVPVGAMISAAP